MKFELLKLDIPTIIDTGLKHGHPRIHVWGHTEIPYEKNYIIKKD